MMPKMKNAGEQNEQKSECQQRSKKKEMKSKSETVKWQKPNIR